jgi:hypothetical protein
MDKKCYIFAIITLFPMTVYWKKNCHFMDGIQYLLQDRMMRSDLSRVVEWFPIESDNGYVDMMVCGMIPETKVLVPNNMLAAA